MSGWRTVACGLACLAMVVAQVPAYAQSELHVDPANQPVGEEPIQATPVFGEINPALQPAIEYAQQDLGTMLGMDNWWDIGVLEARAVTWPDGSLGCPAPDMAYIQVLVDGALIRLWA